MVTCSSAGLSTYNRLFSHNRCFLLYIQYTQMHIHCLSLSLSLSLFLSHALTHTIDVLTHMSVCIIDERARGRAQQIK